MRVLDSGRITHSHNDVSVSIYFGADGRIFSRRNLNQKFGRQEASHQVDAVGDASGQSKINSFGSFEFSGNEMRAYRKTGSGSAGQLAVTFDSNYSTCQGSISYANDGSTSTFRGPSTGIRLQNLGISAGAVSCSVQNGNVFED